MIPVTVAVDKSSKNVVDEQLLSHSRRSLIREPVAACFIMVLAVVSHIFIQMRYQSLPLIGDELYYATPEVLKSLSNWPAYSFGHPPGWNAIHAVVFRILGVDVSTLRLVGLFFSTLFLVVIGFFGMTGGRALGAALMMLIVVCQDYFQNAGSMDHPVIATAAFGFAGLFLAQQKKWWASVICICLAVSFRESALVFVVAVVFLLDRPARQWRVAAIPTAALAFFYLWNYLANKTLLINTQAKVVISTGKSPWVLEGERLWNYLIYLQSQFPTETLLTALFVGMVLLAFGWRPLPTRLGLAFLTVLLLHTLFFGFYIYEAPRIPFLGGMAILFLAVFGWDSRGHSLQRGWLRYASVVMIFVAALIPLFQGISRPLGYLHLKRTSNVHIQVIARVAQLVKKNPQARVTVTNPLSNYMQNPWYGYTPVAVSATWYGGAPGWMSLEDFDITAAPDPANVWPEQDLLKAAKNNDFVLDSQVENFQIWVRTELQR